jgi:dTDP-4-amino-4,6-dideoxygalactose transaminase
MSKNPPIYVTRPSLPPLEEFVSYLEKIWGNHILTNNGPFHKELETELARYLGVEYISLFSNGTLALMIALRTLRLSGEIITTPFSFVATTHSIWWNGIKPVFVDVERDTFNIDPEQIEAAITPNTTAIMPVHVFGNPCNVERLGKIADSHGLKLIYDAAHAFGVKIGENSILNYGDLSVLSFHATKVFSTIEGGAIVCHDEKTKKRIDHLKNFGFLDEVTIIEPGINAKLNEMQSAYGLLQLKYIDRYIEARRKVVEAYRKRLLGVEGITVLPNIPGVRHNYAYFPILIDSAKTGSTRDDIYGRLKEHGIFGRRYFYPLISEFPFYHQHNACNQENLPVASRVASQVICLPLYPDLPLDDVDRISGELLRLANT